MVLKVVLVGDTQVGKTCLVSRLTTGVFRGSSAATVGAAFQDHCISTDRGTVSMQIWDTAGQEKYRSLAPMYYRNAHAAVLVFDITNTPSYEALEQWASEISEKSSGDIRMFIVGNKCDLTEQRKITEEDAREFTFKCGAVEYIETSAVTGVGVLDLFKMIADSCEVATKMDESVDTPSIINSPTGSVDSGCQC